MISEKEQLKFWKDLRIRNVKIKRPIKHITHTIALMTAFLLHSCGLGYQLVKYDKEYNNNILTVKEQKAKHNGNNCHSKEIITQTDTLNNQMIYKEEITRDCKGTYSYVVKRKKWELVDGEMVKSVTKK